MMHLLTFLWAAINNWAGWATGGLVMALIFLGQTLSERWQPSKKLLRLCCLLFLALAVFSAWDDQYTNAMREKTLLEDRAPKLDGFIHRFVIADEPATTNSLVFADVSINNSGGIPSVAQEFKLLVLSRHAQLTNIQELNFSNEFQFTFPNKGKPWLLRLNRQQLISEKTTRAIPIGESTRGWIAFRIGLPMSYFESTNAVLSFEDVAGTRISVTNGLWKGKPGKTQPLEDLTSVIAGAENIFYPIAPPARTNWLPPELPPGCSNVAIFFGTQGLVIRRDVAEITSSGKKFSISELPDFFVKDLDKIPNYSPRQRDIWIRTASSKFTIANRTVDYPIQPVIISNRLYVQVEIPFSNEKRKLVMSDAFTPELPIPPAWDVNFSTNYDAYGNGIYAYEIVNELTNPILQVTYTAPNEVHINGIFQVDSDSILAAFGDEPKLCTLKLAVVETNQDLMTASLQLENFHETLIIRSNETIASFGQRFTNEFFRPIFKNQRALFKYPSNRNLGLFAD